MTVRRVADTDLARVFRAESGRVLASLVSQCHDLELAEDALQDACLQASEQWTQDRIPKNKAAWLLTVARRRLIDRMRQSSHHNKAEIIRAVHDVLSSDADAGDAVEQNQPIPDERLKLIFTCCHPLLSEPARVALTLKTLCGLNAREIARAFLVSEVTMNQRLTRARRKIRDSAVHYQVPGPDSLPDRLPAVLSVIYLIFNESYTAFEGQSLSREDLANEAIRLARILSRLLPSPEVIGLLALMLFHQSRSTARSSTSQAYIPLEDQDRSLWDRSKIKEARKLLSAALKTGNPGAYQIQAAISALHSEADSWEQTDWLQIELLYATLYKLNPSPVVALNLALAGAYRGKLQAALESLNELESSLVSYQPYHAARADIELRSGNIAAARQSYRRAIALTQNNIERDFLLKQLDRAESRETGE